MLEIIHLGGEVYWINSFFVIDRLLRLDSGEGFINVIKTVCIEKRSRPSTQQTPSNGEALDEKGWKVSSSFGRVGKVRIAFLQHSWDDLEMASRQEGN